MRNNLPVILLLSLLILGFGLASSAENVPQIADAVQPGKNHHVLPEIKITVDQATNFEFCIVPLRIGNDAFATREFWLGGRGTGGFKEPPTRCMIAGAVVMSPENKPDWCLVVGKHEVTVAQWNSVLGLPAPEEGVGQMPVTKVSRADVASFIEKANEKIRQHEISKIIVSPFPASFEHSFLRLPTEAEWEFVARGGNFVDSTQFDKQTPYAEDLNRYEWFSGQNSSKGKLKAVALLKPNPLGLHDMLGNVSEMVDGLYQVEYSQGRFGGLVVRGGDFRTDESDMRSSRRIEVPWVFPDGSAYRSSSVGFRLVMGSMIVTTIAQSAELDTAWQKYAATRVQPVTSVPATASLSQSSGQELEEINRLTKSLAHNFELGAGKTLSTKETLALMETQTASLRGRLNAAEAFFAKGAVRLASIVSAESVGNLSKKKVYENLNDPGPVQKRAIQIIEDKLGDAGSVMEESCKMLAQVSEPALEDAFSEHLKMLRKRSMDTQASATEVAKKTALEYVKNRHLDIDEWKKNLQQLADSLNPNPEVK